MIDISAEIANRISILLEDVHDAIPEEMRSLISLLSTQIRQLKCDEGLLIEIITLLQTYYDSSKSEEQNDTNSKNKQEEDGKMDALIIALHQMRAQEIQAQNLKIRR